MGALSVAAVSGRTEEPSAIDEDHLERMTLGDRRLEREVLEIFVRQASIMLGRIATAEPAHAAAAAHTLLGSARGIGTWRVARAAESLEQAAGKGLDQAIKAAIGELEAAIAEARSAIGARLADTIVERSPELSRDH